MIEWALWALFLVLQNFSQTVSQRAKTMDSLWYTGISGIFSNGSWIVANFFMVDLLVKIKSTSDWLLGVATVVFYVAWCVFGTVVSQYCAMRWFENWRKR